MPMSPQQQGAFVVNRSKLREGGGEGSAMDKWEHTMPAMLNCQGTSGKLDPRREKDQCLCWTAGIIGFRVLFKVGCLDEILTNANARLNVVSDLSGVRPPTTGYHCNLFMIKALDNFKLVVAATMTSYGSVPCGRWDHHTAGVMSHVAFQPFRWPLMTDESPTWVDLKVKLEGDLLIHLELRGYRSDHDMSVQICHVADSLSVVARGETVHPHFCGHSFSRLACDLHVLGSWGSPICSIGRWSGGSSRLPVCAMWSSGWSLRLHLMLLGWMLIGWSFGTTVDPTD